MLMELEPEYADAKPLLCMREIYMGGRISTGWV